MFTHASLAYVDPTNDAALMPCRRSCEWQELAQRCVLTMWPQLPLELLALLLAHASESDRWQPPGVKVGASWAFDMMHKEHNDRGDEAGVARRPGAKRLLRVPPFVRKASGKAKGKGKAQG